MVSTARDKRTVLALLLIAFFTISNEAWPTLGATMHRSEQITLGLDEMAQKSPTMRRLTWWKWGKGDNKKTETTAVELPTTESSLLQALPKTTERSRWRSWFSSAKNKFSKAVDKVKTEIKGAKESYDRGMSFVGSAAKEGIVGAGRAISSGAKTVGNATITAGRSIKAGAKKFGSMLKTGFQKIRLKVSGEDEKFKIVANRLKDKLEAGDEKALDLMNKLGINITYTGNKISGSQIADRNISVAEILQTEGILSNRSSSYHTAVEQPEEAGPVLADYSPPNTTVNDDFHSAEDYLDSVNSSLYTTDKVKHFNITPTIYLPALIERSSSTSLPTEMSNKTATYSTQTAFPSIVPTVTISTDISEPTMSSTRYAHISSTSKSTPIVPKTAGTRLANAADLITPTTSYRISISPHPNTSESIIIPLLISSSPLNSTISSSAATASSTLPITSSESTSTFTNEIPYPNSTSTDFTASSFSTHSTNSETGLPTETTNITATSTPLQHISTTQTPSSTSTSTITTTQTPSSTSSSTITTTQTPSSTSTSTITTTQTPSSTSSSTITTTQTPSSTSTSTIATTYSTSTSPTIKAAETTSSTILMTTASSTILMTTASSTISLPVDPSTSLKPTEATQPIKTSRPPFSEEETFIEPNGPEDEGTLVEAEPYEPPPFPDIFSDIEVHNRLKEFYDKGDFSHSEMIEIFNFDPDNYEYYDY